MNARRPYANRPALRGALGALVATAWLTALGGTDARADVGVADAKVRCVAAAEAAQQLRREEQFSAAQRELERCRRPECPTVVQSDCASWQRELAAEAPTLLLRPRTASGEERTDGRVLVDGVLRQESYDGAPLVVDPGEHEITFEAKDGTARAAVVVMRGDRNRPLALIVQAPSAAASLPPEPPAPSVDRRGTLLSTVPTASIVLAGVSLAAAASFVAFGSWGSAEADELRATCAPRCAKDALDAPRAKFIAADASLATSLVALAASVAIWSIAPRKTSGVGYAPARGGGFAWLAVRF